MIIKLNVGYSEKSDTIFYRKFRVVSYRVHTAMTLLP